MAEENWIKVFETSKMHEALLIQSVLAESNIQSVILNHQDSIYVTLGEISVMVALEHSIDAINIIEDSTGTE